MASDKPHPKAGSLVAAASLIKAIRPGRVAGPHSLNRQKTRSGPLRTALETIRVTADATSDKVGGAAAAAKVGTRAVTKNKVYSETPGADWENQRGLCASRLSDDMNGRQR
jgi:hypothetical protein